MFGLGLATKIFIPTEGIDMRKGFEGLHGFLPLQKACFAFVADRRASCA
jgi:hypothetical protein